MPEQPVVLVTHHGTVLCVDPESGDLVHRRIEICTPNLAFTLRDNTLALSETFEVHKRSDETSKMIGQMPISLEFSKDKTKFGFKINGHYACAADNDDKITFSRLRRGPWEEFSPVDIITFYEAKIASMKQRATPLIRLPRKYAIPKNIHQIFISESYQLNLNEHLRKNIDHLKQSNPGWSYKLWTAKEIHDAIYDWYGFELLEIYQKINPKYSAARADFFRYLCIYKSGGVYLDLKSSAAGPLDVIIGGDDQYLLSRWNNGPEQSFPNSGMHRELEHVGGEFQQWHVIAAPGHPFLEQVILDVLRNITQYHEQKPGAGKMGVLRVTGPIAYTLAIHKIIGLYEHRIFDSEAAGLIFNAGGSRPAGFHRHYSMVEESIVF